MSLLPGSQPTSPDQGFPPPRQNPTHTSHPDHDMMGSAAVLVQNVDQIVQASGLSKEGHQQLYLFAIQVNASVESLWIYAITLQHTDTIITLWETVQALSTWVNEAATLIWCEWKMTEAQQTAMKELERHLIVTSKTSYWNLAACAKNFVATYLLQFLMPAYSSDPLVRKAVNAELDHLAHQIWGSFRKLIFTGVVGGHPLVQLTKGIVEMYSNQPSLGMPIQVQAHIAQLCLIATEIIATMPALNTESDASGSNPCKCLRNDTGFWATVDAKFIQLVDTHREDYNSPWMEDVSNPWETHIIGVDSDHFSDLANQLPPEAINHWANTGADPED